MLTCKNEHYRFLSSIKDDEVIQTSAIMFKTKGKEYVLCFYCSKKIRKDTVERHCSSAHPAEKPVFKPLESETINPLTKYFLGQQKQKEIISDETNTIADVGDIYDDNNDVHDASHSVCKKGTGKRTADMIPPASPMKKIRSAEDDSEDRLEIFKKDLLCEIGSKFDDFQSILSSSLNAFSTSSTSKTNTQSKFSECRMTSSEINDIIYNCSNIEDLENIMKTYPEDIPLKKMENKDGSLFYYCVLCVNKPSSLKDCKKQENNNGIFSPQENSQSSSSESSGDIMSRQFRNLKSSIKKHLFKNKSHQENLEFQSNKEQFSRQEKVGLNIFRLRYQGLKKAKSLQEFESDILVLKLNGGDVGDINHSRKFAKQIDKAVYENMRTCLAEKLGEKLDATDDRRPVGFIMDKMTPSKRTGQVHGIVTPIPENELTEDFLVPIMLDLPVCRDLMV